MEEKDEWVFFKEIDWNCPKNNRFNVDTRDFHCGYRFDSKEHKDISTLNKYPDFFFTEQELKSELERLYTESGGEGEWRCLCLNSNDNRVTNWGLKYLRIYRTDKGFIICNSYHKAINKTLLACKINQELLGHH